MKDPTVRASLAAKALPFALVLVGLCAAATASAQPLDEQRVIALARRQAPEAAVADSRSALIRAEETAAGLHPNPSVQWQRAHFPAEGGRWQAEDTLALNLPVNLSGERYAARDLARSATHSQRADAARVRADAVREALALFYAALAAEQRAQITAITVERLDEAARVVTARVQQGTASGYDQARLSIEADLARSQLRQARIERRALRTALVTQLGMEPGAATELRGSLRVRAPAAGSGDERASVASARAALAEAQSAQKDARSAWVPTLTLRGGLRMQQTDARRYGYVAGAMLSLPIFDRGQDARARAGARREFADSDLDARLRQTRSDRERARILMTSLHDELTRLEQETLESTQRLLTAVASGYREGERSLVELVDAERTRARVALRRVEIALQAKGAELALRAANGEFE